MFPFSAPARRWFVKFCSQYFLSVSLSVTRILVRLLTQVMAQIISVWTFSVIETSAETVQNDGGKSTFFLGRFIVVFRQKLSLQYQRMLNNSIFLNTPITNMLWLKTHRKVINEDFFIFLSALAYVYSKPTVLHRVRIV